MDRATTVLRDFDEASEELAAVGVKRIVLIGLCWGADDAVYIASQRDNVIGIVAFDGFAYPNRAFQTRHYLRRSLSPAAWGRLVKRAVSREASVSGVIGDSAQVNDLALRDWPERSEMIDRYRKFLNKGVRLLSVFSQGQNYYNHVGQLAENLPDCDKAHLQEVYFDDADHTFSLTAHRERLVELVEEWIQSEINSGK
jgi:pimeloyl-ACP methyl ester carboxylesterase